jgi:hypothetical protein
MESEGLLRCFQELATCSHTNPDESSLHGPTVFLADAFQCYHLHHAGRAMAHAVSRRPFTAEELNPKSVYMGYVAEKVALRQIFLRVLRLSHVSILPPMPHNHSFVRLLQRHTRLANDVVKQQTSHLHLNLPCAFSPSFSLTNNFCSPSHLPLAPPVCVMWAS